MADKVPTTSATVVDFEARINKAYGGNVIQTGTAASLRMQRCSSGILSLDCALGGGWVFGCIQIIAGEYSTGKTVKALKAAQMVEQYDHTTHLRKDLLSSDQLANFVPGRVLFVDVENAFNEAWAVANGWNLDWHYIAKPEYAEQAIDVITDAIRDNLFDMIIVDSVAALTPSKEIEESAEDWQMGLAARLMNKAVRRWNGSLSKLAQQPGAGGPCVMLLNQFRLKLGIQFGDPRTMPCGKGQEFAAAVIVYTKGAKVGDDSKEDHGYGEYGGVIYKNKTFLPKCNFVYRMSLREQDDWAKGEIDNPTQAVALGRSYGLINRPAGSSREWEFNGECFKTLKEIEDRFRNDEVFRLLLWRSIISAFGGSPN